MTALAGRVVWVTRLRGAGLCRLIRAQGGVAVAFPVMAIVPPPQPPEHLEARVRAADMTIHVSRNAVQWAVRLLPDALWELLCTRPAYCPGQATAEQLLALGCREVRAAPENQGSEGLLTLPGLQSQQTTGRSIIIFRGVGGRDLLGRELERRAAQVDCMEVYARARRTLQPGALAELYARRPPDCVEVSSMQGLGYLRTLWCEAMGRAPAALRVVVPASRLLEACRELGFGAAVAATDASDPAMYDGVLAAVQQT